jgi:DNA/RNA endonuclease YhcR with UshA esterase domain
MVRTRTWIGLLSLLLAISPFVRAEDKDEKKDAKDDKASAPAVIQATDKDAIAAAKDKDAVVEGVVSRVGASKSGSITFINFKDVENGQFTAVVMAKNKDAVSKALDGDIAKALTGAKIQVKGKMTDYKGKPQIQIDKPEQVTVVEKAKGGDEAAHQ